MEFIELIASAGDEWERRWNMRSLFEGVLSGCRVGDDGAEIVPEDSEDVRLPLSE